MIQKYWIHVLSGSAGVCLIALSVFNLEPSVIDLGFYYSGDPPPPRDRIERATERVPMN